MPLRNQGRPRTNCQQVRRKRHAQPPEQVPMIQVNGKLEVGEATSMQPPPEWKPPFVDPALWGSCYHPSAGLRDDEWLVVWCLFGPGRGNVALTSKHLLDREQGWEGPAPTPAIVKSVLAQEHVQAACEHVRNVLSMTCLSEQDLRAWWSNVVRNERIELQHRLNASSHLAKSMALFVEKKEIKHDIHVDLSKLSNEELAKIAAGEKHQIGSGAVVDATLTTTATADRRGGSEG